LFYFFLKHSISLSLSLFISHDSAPLFLGKRDGGFSRTEKTFAGRRDGGFSWKFSTMILHQNDASTVNLENENLEIGDERWGFQLRNMFGFDSMYCLDDGDLSAERQAHQDWLREYHNIHQWIHVILMMIMKKKLAVLFDELVHEHGYPCHSAVLFDTETDEEKDGPFTHRVCWERERERERESIKKLEHCATVNSNFLEKKNSSY